MTTNNEFLRRIDALIVDIGSDYRREMVGIIEDLRHVFDQPDGINRKRERDVIASALEEDVQTAVDVGDVLCALFANCVLNENIETATQLFALLADYSTKDDASVYRKTLNKLKPFITKQ